MSKCREVIEHEKYLKAQKKSIDDRRKSIKRAVYDAKLMGVRVPYTYWELLEVGIGGDTAYKTCMSFGKEVK